MLYPQTSGSNFNLETQTNAYDEEMKKYIEAAKMYPYYFMNQQLGSSINPSLNPSLNPSINPNLNPSSLNPSLSSQFGGLPMPISNPYLGYPGNSSLPVPPYGQLKNLSRGLPASGLPFGMGSYPSPGFGSMYPPQNMGPYSPSNLLGGYGQTVPPSFSHAMGLDKNELNSKTPQLTGFGLNHDFEKKYLSSQQTKNDFIQRLEKEKSLPKDSKFMLPHRNLPFNPQLTTPLNGNVNKPEDSKSLKPNPVEYITKKQPFKDAKKLSEPNPHFKTCACKGLYEYESSFICSICNNKFHYRCLTLPQKGEDYSQSEIACAHCRMRMMDPLNKVEQTLGQFYLMNLYEKGFVSTINFRPYESKCKDKQSKYEIQIRCIRSGEHMKNLEITWPDECQIKINNDRIVDIPALQSNSSLKKRKDYSVFITQNIYLKGGYVGTEAANLLEKVKMSLELKPLTPQEANSKRIRNDYTFALGVYLVEKLNADELYAKIMSEQKVEDVDFLKNLMKTKEDQVQIDKITIKLIDPFSWDFIKTPVRGHKCNHAQCFDLKTFISLMYSAKNRTWKCPLCTRDARKFMLDGEQMQLIKKAHEFDPIPKQVSIFKEGKVMFNIEKDSEEQDQAVSQNNKTKKITKEKKEEVIKEK